jgi:uncharacterized protein YjbJ (UPF0337 family)
MRTGNSGATQRDQELERVTERTPDQHCARPRGDYGAIAWEPFIWIRPLHQKRRVTMGNADEAKGRVKRAAGELIGDGDLKREGTVDKAAGKAKDAVDKVSDKAKGEVKKR